MSGPNWVGSVCVLQTWEMPFSVRSPSQAFCAWEKVTSVCEISGISNEFERRRKVVINTCSHGQTTNHHCSDNNIKNVCEHSCAYEMVVWQISIKLFVNPLRSHALALETPFSGPEYLIISSEISKITLGTPSVMGACGVFSLANVNIIVLSLVRVSLAERARQRSDVVR